MLKKLIKHELIYILRTFWPIYFTYLIITFAVCLIPHLFRAFGTITMLGEIILFIFTGLYIIATIVLILMAVFDNIRRYSNNMFSDEGYLTNTLPVPMYQHLVAKLVGGIINFLASIIVTVAGFIMIGGKEGFILFGKVWNNTGLKEEVLSAKSLGILFFFTSIYLFVVTLGYLMCSVNLISGAKSILGVLLSIIIVILTILSASKLGEYCIMAKDLSELQSVIVCAVYLLILAALMFTVSLLTIRYDLNLQ